MVAELRRDTQIPEFFMCPKFILQHHLSGTAICMYMLLFERARLSQQNDKWIDESGNVFELYTLSELEKSLGRSRRCVQNALYELEDAGLIRKERISSGGANKIFIIMQDKAAQFSAPVYGRFMREGEADLCAAQTQNSAPECGSNVRLSNNNRVINTEQYNISNRARPRLYGKYANVYLTDEEYAELQSAVPNLTGLIEKMSAYLATTGKSYQNYAAALNSWAAREPKSYRDKKYECTPDESL